MIPLMNAIIRLVSTITQRYIYLLVIILLASSAVASAERVRLERKHGVVNAILHDILKEQISLLKRGLGKIELNSISDNKKSCKVDLFVSPKTIYTVAYDSKTKFHAEFYVDHPTDLFKDVLFQAIVKDDKSDAVQLSVDTKTLSYKFHHDKDSLLIEIDYKDEEFKCSFNLNDAVLISGQTE